MRKGQYLTIEQLIVFGMSIFLVATITYMYNTANRTAKSVATTDQFTEGAELILGNIIYVYNSGKNSDLNTEVAFDIPQKLGSQAYFINLSKSVIFIQSLEDSKVNSSVQVGRINNTVNLYGNATSIRGRIKINYDLNSNSIVLRDI